MKNLFKKICMLAVGLSICLGASAGLVGCFGGKDPETQIMNVAVNPSLEFVVDEDDEVVSVTATNEDGAYILEKFSNFTGMDAEEAALKLLELSEQYGFVVSGTLSSEKITISVSGEGAEELYNDVKEEMQNKATELGLTFNNLVKVTKEDIQAKVAEMYQEYTESEIADFTEEELIAKVKASRQETKDLFTDDEKQAYYRERAQKVLEAKIDAIEAYIEDNGSLLNVVLTPLVAALNTAYAALETAYATLNAQIDALYEAASTGINAKRDEYVEAKKEYLAKVEEYKDALANSENTTVLKQELQTLKAQAETMKTTLETQRANAKAELMTKLETTIHTQLASLNTAINNVLEHISLTANEINTQVQTQITALVNEHKNNAQNPWEEIAE